jgi:hypothetical protein
MFFLNNQYLNNVAVHEYEYEYTPRTVLLFAAVAILIEVFCGFPYTLQANAGIVPKFGHEKFLTHPFQFIFHLSPFHSTLYSLGLLKRRL